MQVHGASVESTAYFGHFCMLLSMEVMAELQTLARCATRSLCAIQMSSVCVAV